MFSKMLKNTDAEVESERVSPKICSRLASPYYTITQSLYS